VCAYLVEVDCGGDYFHITQAELFALAEDFPGEYDAGTSVEVEAAFSVASLLIGVLVGVKNNGEKDGSGALTR